MIIYTPLLFIDVIICIFFHCFKSEHISCILVLKVGAQRAIDAMALPHYYNMLHISIRDTKSIFVACLNTYRIYKCLFV